jgi:cell division protein FtsQ
MFKVVRIRQGNRRRPDRGEQVRGLFVGLGQLLRRVVPYAFLAVVAFGLPYLILQAYAHTLTSTYFAVASIEAEGFVHVHADRALEEAGLVYGKNVFTVDLRQAEAQLEALAFVRSARVERRLPDRLRVLVEEYQPVAVIIDEWFWLVDKSGEPFVSVDVRIWSELFDDLPLISGVSVEALGQAEGKERFFQALEVAKLYEEMGLQARQPLSQVHVDAVMGISLVTEETGTEIRLGWGRWNERLERFRVVQNSLIERGVDADYVLIDQEEDLSRVAVGQRHDPGKGEASSNRPR